MKDFAVRTITNKYVFTGLIFAVWITFIHDIDLIYVMKANKELKELKKEVVDLEDKNKHTRALLEDYQSNPKTAEQFAREEYYMKKIDEDIYIVREER